MAIDQAMRFTAFILSINSHSKKLETLQKNAHFSNGSRSTTMSDAFAMTIS